MRASGVKRKWTSSGAFGSWMWALSLARRLKESLNFCKTGRIPRMNVGVERNVWGKLGMANGSNNGSYPSNNSYGSNKNSISSKLLRRRQHQQQQQNKLNGHEINVWSQNRKKWWKKTISSCESETISPGICRRTPSPAAALPSWRASRPPGPSAWTSCSSSSSRAP